MSTSRIALVLALIFGITTAVALRAQPPLADASRKRSASSVGLVAERGECADERLLPDPVGERKHVLAEDGEQHRPSGRRPHRPASKLVVHGRAHYTGRHIDVTA